MSVCVGAHNNGQQVVLPEHTESRIVRIKKMRCTPKLNNLGFIFHCVIVCFVSLFLLLL